jgi:hypothetical protein
VPFRIQCHRRGFSNTHSVWRMKEIRDDSVAQFRDGLALASWMYPSD